MTITGVLSYQEFEGGFWGIIEDEGQKYYPLEGIPTSLQQNDLQVEAEIEPSNEISFVMWGQAVHLQAIRRL
jgi:hypothetical protein